MALSTLVYLLAFRWILIQISQNEGIEAQRRDAVGSFTYINFMPHHGTRLSLPLSFTDIQQKSQSVHEDIDCMSACLEHLWCHSMNYKIAPQKDDRHVCELLSTDQYNNSNHFIPDLGFIHFSISSPCESNPCSQNGTCIALYNKLDYYCVCAAGFTGRKCSQDGLLSSRILSDIGNTNYISTLYGYLLPVIQNTSSISWIKCWRAKTDGSAATTFHSKCDGKGPTVTIIRVGRYVFGGFTDMSWHIRGDYSLSSRSFLYSLYNTKGYFPIKLTLTGNENQRAIYGNSGAGPVFGFGSDIYISNDAINNQVSHSRPSSYQPPPGCSYRDSTCSFLAGSHSFTPSDVEVFYETST